MTLPSKLFPYPASPAAASASPRTSLMTIGDMARHFSVTLRTLRFYEARGLLEPHRFGTARFYGPEDRRRLELILKGKSLGFTLTEIRDFIARETATEHGALPLSADRIAEQIEFLQRQRAGLDHAIRELLETRARLAVAG